MKKCLICKNNFEPFISFGMMPIANGFLPSEKFDEEYFFELQAGFCSSCKTVQLVNQPKREMMFHDNYAFFSSTSKGMANHFRLLAENTMKKYLAQNDNNFVVEIGCNDGILLKHFAKAGINHIGVEPSLNVALEANKNGVNTISEFFDENVAKKIIDKYGNADLILAANVMCHIPYIHSVMAGIKKLLKPKGVFIFEDPYLGDIVEKTSYDQIYDEHVFYFSITSVNNLLKYYDLEIIDIFHQKVHGGSMRYLVSHKGKRNISDSVIKQIRKEEEIGLNLLQTYDNLRKRIEKSRDQLIKILKDINEKGKRVVGYAATSKSTTVINYCGINKNLLEYICDTTPIKQGLFTPGAHIPVKPYSEFLNNYPDYALLFAWNHFDEIWTKEHNYNKIGKWVLYVPEVKII